MQIKLAQMSGFVGATAVCIDRRTGYMTMSRAKDLKALTVNDLTLKLTAEIPFKVKTITSDRGTEFKIPLKELDTYYCDPQAPQQLGRVSHWQLESSSVRFFVFFITTFKAQN